MRHRVSSTGGLALALTILVYGLTWQCGAFSAEMSRYPDEPAHLVTGIMVDRWVHSDQWTSPLAHAERYYAHYPKVAFGHWPPVYYLLQAAWTVLFGISRVSIVSLHALILVASGMVIFLLARHRIGSPLAAAASVGYVFLPAVQYFATAVMVEQLLSLLVLLAAAAWARYLAHPTRPHLAWFCALFVTAVMTKGNAWALLPVLPLTLLLTGRQRLLLRPSLWLALTATLALLVPYHLWTAAMVSNGFEEPVRWASLPLNALRLAGFALSNLGVFASVLAATALLWMAVRRVADPFWVSMACLAISVIVFHAWMPAGIEMRRVHQALAPLILVAGLGGHRLAEAMLGGRAARPAAAVLSVLLAGTCVTPPTPKSSAGFGVAASDLLRRPGLHRLPILISSPGDGEGAFIAEMALQSPDPRWQTLRASKLLAESDWSGADYRFRASSPPAVLDLLDRAGVGTILLDRSTSDCRSRPHHALLLEAIASRPGEWREVLTWPAAPWLSLLQRRDFATVAPPCTPVDLRRMLGRSVHTGCLERKQAQPALRAHAGVTPTSAAPAAQAPGRF